MNWDELSASPGEIKLYALETGRLHMAGNIHFNNQDPRFRSMPKDKRFNPVYSFLAIHPREGLMLLDAGLHGSFARQKNGNFGFLLGAIVKTRAEQGRSAPDRIRELGFSPDEVRHVFLSHLHLDHLSGLPAFESVKGLKVHVDPLELKELGGAFSRFKGYIKPHLDGFDVRPIRYTDNLPPFEKAWDVFGDGSIIVVSTPGHTPGHASAVVRTAAGAFFLTFDAAHRRDNIESDIPPKGDLGQGRDSLSKIKSFLAAHPEVRPVFGHDPDQATTLDAFPKMLG